MNAHEVIQGSIAIGSLVGTFVLIGLDKIQPEQGLAIIMALLGGLGIGYTNGKKEAQG